MRIRSLIIFIICLITCFLCLHFKDFFEDSFLFNKKLKNNKNYVEFNIYYANDYEESSNIVLIERKLLNCIKGNSILILKSKFKNSTMLIDSTQISSVSNLNKFEVNKLSEKNQYNLFYFKKMAKILEESFFLKIEIDNKKTAIFYIQP